MSLNENGKLLVGIR